MSKVSWGILSTARIGVAKVIPALQKGRLCTVTALASRDLAKAQAAARKLRIPQAHGSYEALLADPEIDAVYNPLPNHLHVDWSIKALEAGKHVLCEKPLGLDVADAQRLLDAAARYPHLKVMEAFMYRHHPQWQLAKRLVNEGQIGDLRTIQTIFSYYLVDPNDVRNQADIGGGGLMDIGCYAISLSRFIFDAEPERPGAVEKGEHAHIALREAAIAVGAPRGAHEPDLLVVSDRLGGQSARRRHFADVHPVTSHEFR